MKYVKTYEEYINEYNEYNEQYYDELVLEKLNLGPLFKKFKHAVDKASIASLIVGTLLTVFTATQAANYISDLDILTRIEKTELIQLLKKKDKKFDKIKSIIDVRFDKDLDVDMNLETDKIMKNNLHDPLSLNLSEDGLNVIKKHEGLRLKAYSIGDGKITVGYGHAEPQRNSKYKVGDRISEQEATKLLKQDLHEAESGVKRIFKQWKDKGIHVKITQGQYDAMVSMAYNMGVGGLRRSKFIQYVKKNDMKKAAEEIKKTGIRKGFGGLEKRRNSEFALFTP